MPVWLMRQAGRYLPEYRALRAQAGGFLDLCLTPEHAIEITLQPVRRFGMDAAILFSDILIVPYGLGQALDYREGEGPVLTPIRTPAELDRLTMAGFAGRIAPILATVAGVRAAQPADCTLIGFAGGAWTVAAYMIEGHGGGEFAQAKRMMGGDTPLFDRVIDLIVEATIHYMVAQADAGAECLQIFDSWAGLLDTAGFHRYVIEPTQRIVTGIKAKHPAIKIIGFPRLAGDNYTAYATTSGVDAVGLDTTVSLERARAMKLPTQGNLDPALLIEGGGALTDGVIKIVQALKGKPHIFNLGHGVIKETNPDHVAQLVAAVRAA
jgi:uroporphyrinogen decarboxylase